MTSYLVTGGAGFIGSHLAEELVRRGHRVRVVDSLITGNRHNLDHIPGRRLHGRRSGGGGRGRARGAGNRLRAASGRDSVGAAIGQGSGDLESRQHRRVVERARRGPRCRGQAPGLRGVVVRVWRHADAAEARGHADRPAVALCAPEAGGGTVLPDVHPAVRPRNRARSGTSTSSARGRIQVRRTPASSRCSRRRCSRAGSRSSTATASRPATSLTSPTWWTAC